MKLYFETLPVIEAAIVDVATRNGIESEALQKRFENIMHAELGKVNAERKEAKPGNKSALWAKIKIKNNVLSGSQKQTQVLTVKDGVTLQIRVVDVYNFSAGVVKFEEEFGDNLISQVPATIENWLDQQAKKILAKESEPVEA